MHAYASGNGHLDLAERFLEQHIRQHELHL